MFEFSDPSEPPVFELPDCRELEKNGLQLLRRLVEFSEQGSSFVIPSTHNELVGLVRLADYMGVDTFLKAASLWLDVSVDAISNHNPVGKVYKLIRGRYRASRHKGCIDNMTELCIYCFKRITLSPAGMSPCCRRKVHKYCKPREPHCRVCHQLYAVLPCVVCKLPIDYGTNNFAAEYEAAVLHRTPCCEADCHPSCKSSTFNRCPLCMCPLLNWEIDTEMEMAGDVLARRRMTHLNDIRRKENLPYDVTPPYKPLVTPPWSW